VNDLIPPSTLRDLRAHLVQPQVATVMAGVAAILGLSGPFETWNTQSLPLRMLYWALVVWLTYSAGFVVTALLHPYASRQGPFMRTLGTALAVAIVVFCLLFLLNLLFGQGPQSPGSALASFAAVFVICLVIEIAAQVFAAKPTAALPLATPQGPPAILLRLPVQKRGVLLSLSVQDHYVDVVTTKGREMLLMRLGDAIRETSPVTGLQVHRSHWVAQAAVSAAEKRGDGALLTLINGQTVPVSRAFMPAIRQAGLLPQKGTPHG
jgi:uncharacterized membrane protein